MLKGTAKSPPFKHSEGKKIPGLQGQSPYSTKQAKKKPDKIVGLVKVLKFRGLDLNDKHIEWQI
jgi:hypothetical protein